MRAICCTVALAIGGFWAVTANAAGREVDAGQNVTTLAATAAAITVNPATKIVSREGFRMNFS